MQLSAQEKEQRFRAVLEAVPHGVLGTDEKGHIVLCNGEAEKMFGYEPGELLGKSIEVLVPERSRDVHPGLRSEYHAHPEKRRMGAGRDLAGRRKDGSEFPAEIGLNPMHTAHGMIVVASVVDISERKLSEAKLQEAYDEIRRRNGEMERLIYSVSHDLRTPLAVAMGAVELLRDDPGDAAASAEIFEMLGHAHRQMRELIEDLLELSRAGGMALKPEMVEMDRLIADVLQTAAPLAAAKGLRIETAPDFPSLSGDPARLRQVFQNLVTNAIKYGADAETPVIRVFWRETPAEYRFCVADNGAGIPPEAHERIFEVFQRLSTEQEGTGIGLAIVARIAALHGGKAWVESKPGEGSAFWISLPKDGAKQGG